MAVVVLGGHGFFGRLVVEELLSSTRAPIVVAGRSPRWIDGWDRGRVRLESVDQRDHAALKRLLDGARVLVHCAGPYQGLEPSALRASLEARVAYVDLADDREFVQRAESVVHAAGPDAPPVLLGMSFVPGLCATLVELVRRELGPLKRVRCIAAPGARGSRGRATLESLLGAAGRRFEIPRNDSSESTWGWSQPLRVTFPAPIGRRTAYLAIPVADFDLYPRWFDCRDVEFRACSDLPALDRALWVLAGAQRTSTARVLLPMALAMQRLVRSAGRFASDAGAGLVELFDGERAVRVAVVAPERGERLPALPAAFAAVELLDGKLHDRHGLVPPHEALEPARVIAKLRERAIATWIDRGHGWMPSA